MGIAVGLSLLLFLTDFHAWDKWDDTGRSRRLVPSGVSGSEEIGTRRGLYDRG
jgi:hypothetical protein